MKFKFQIQSFEEYKSKYLESVAQPENFWAKVAEEFVWKRKWEKVLEWNFTEPKIKWFTGGRLNITENCLDRHLPEKKNQPAIIWEPNNPLDAKRVLTYQELFERVVEFAGVLRMNGVHKGDRVCIYMPMIPELAIAVLACARIGAIHSVVFGGFSAQSIADRINDAGCKLVITADGAHRGTKTIALKEVIDDALVQCVSIEKVIVYTHTGTPISMIKGRDLWWEKEVEKFKKSEIQNTHAEVMEAEDELFILYTSGSTGKPKGVVHTCAGYMVYAAYTFVNVFQFKPGQVHFCTADIGWITGHSYLLYGPLCAGATTVMFEGIPTYPDAGRFWSIIEKYKVNIFYTAPTAIRSLMQSDTGYTAAYDLNSLQTLGTVGEPINEEAWHWYNTNVGKGRCPITDTWWQTETGGILIAPLAGITKTKPSYATLPLPGIQPVLLNDKGELIEENNVTGNLCIKFPWPGMIRTTYGDHERCRQNYFSAYPGYYFTGDGCFRDKDGNYRITGRVDDVLNVSGHRIGTAEVEDAINKHTGVIESAVVGFPHPIKGQGIYAYVICKEMPANLELSKADILMTVSRLIGPLAKPDKIQFVLALPKTRSGKIMRRILRKIAEGELDNLGDTSTLLDPHVVDEIILGRL